MSLIVAKIENYQLRRHPLIGILIAVSVGLMALFFYRLCVDYLQLAVQGLKHREMQASLSFSVIKPLASWTMVIFAMIFPVLTTLSLSQEWQQKSIYFFANSQISATKMVLGKFLNLLLVLLFFLCILASMIATLSMEATLNWTYNLCVLLAVGLVGSCLLSFGLFISALISQPLLAIGVTFIGNTLWILLEWLNPFPYPWAFLGKHFSLLNHSQYLLNGILYSPDLVYDGLFIGFWLSATIYLVSYKMTRVTL